MVREAQAAASAPWGRGAATTEALSLEMQWLFIGDVIKGKKKLVALKKAHRAGLLTAAGIRHRDRGFTPMFYAAQA